MTAEEFRKEHYPYGVWAKDLYEFAEAYAKHYAEGSISMGIYTEELKKIEALQKQVEELKGLLKGILSLKDLWLITGKVKVEHEGEARALFRMKHEIEQTLKQK